MAKVRVVLNQAEVRKQLLQSPAVVEMLDGAMRAAAEGANGVEVTTVSGGVRARSFAAGRMAAETKDGRLSRILNQAKV